LVEEKKSITEQEDQMLIKHYNSCRNQVGGKVRMEQMLKLIGYLETKEWMK
jgi:hypothetical protein